MSRLLRSQFSLHIAPVRWINGTRSTATLLQLHTLDEGGAVESLMRNSAGRRIFFSVEF
jgi:hypothetical protein